MCDTVAAVAGRGRNTVQRPVFKSFGVFHRRSLQLVNKSLAADSDRGYNGGTMFSISRFLGHDEKFFDLLEASAQQADSSVHHLIELLANLEKSESSSNLNAFAESSREDKRITNLRNEKLSK